MVQKKDYIIVRMMPVVTLLRKDYVSMLIILNDNSFEMIAPIYSAAK